MKEFPVFGFRNGSTYLLRYHSPIAGVQSVLVATFQATISQVFTDGETGQVFYRIDAQTCPDRGGRRWAFPISAERFGSTRWLRRLCLVHGGAGAIIECGQGANLRRAILQLSGIETAWCEAPANDV